MNRKKFGAYVRKNRYSQGYTMVEAADLIGISDTQLQNIEMGKAAPRPATFMKIVNALGLDAKEAVNELEDEGEEKYVDTVDER